MKRLLLILALPVCGWADDVAPLEKVKAGMAALKSVYLEFTQERHLSLFAEPLKSEGVMLIEKPDRIRWETTAPYQTILLGDHKSVAQFEDGKKLKLGFPQMLQRVMEQMTWMHQGNLDALTADYTVTVTNTSIVLIPKDANIRGMLAAIEMHMAPEFVAVREIVMREPAGDSTRIILANERRDVTYPVGTFDQSKPLPLADVKRAVNHAP
ncbi:MAG: Outer-membrane lipoprotein carrier protein [Verrucomicrobiae bacterium]|nr:Outer-membrane lipoprotein carrier protein [Verrucomicrobiae bacterium]